MGIQSSSTYFFTLITVYAITLQPQAAWPQALAAEAAPNSAQSVERVGAVPLPTPKPTEDLGMQSPSFTRLNAIAKPTFEDEPAKKRSFDATLSPGRLIYLNGENIGSIRNQDLENVNLHIDQNGNVHIQAPQYEVETEQSYHPLLPKELPQFQKAPFYDNSNLPKGTHSKN